MNSGTRGGNNWCWSTTWVGAVGAGIGLFGGPAGAAAGFGIGSTVGGWLGGKTGDDASVNYREITLNVGDNLNQIQQQFTERLQDSIQVQMTGFSENSIGNSFK